MVKLPPGLSHDQAIEELRMFARLVPTAEGEAVVGYAVELIERERKVDGYIRQIFGDNSYKCN